MRSVMNLVFYKTNDGDNVINKTLTNPLTVPIKAKRDFNIYSPVIDLLDGGMNLRQYNYCIITELSRCYFIDNVEIISNDILRFSLKLDVLETYKTDILNSDTRFLRAIKSGDYGKFTINESHIKTITKHSSDVTIDTTGHLVLTTLGQ